MQIHVCFSKYLVLRQLLFTVLLLLLLPTYAIGQNQFYEVFGETKIACSFEGFLYIIETSADVWQTTWEVLPPGGASIISSDEVSAEIQFLAPGSYTIIVTSLIDSLQITLSDTLQVNVSGFASLPDVLGCYLNDSQTGCYQVCAFSHTILSHPDGQTIFLEFEISGAESYTSYIFDPAEPNWIDITWGAGGSGSVTLYTGSCQSRLCFEILPVPDADFFAVMSPGADTITVCKNQEIYFENTSTNGLEYTWDFGDGSHGQDLHANHAYETEGTYTVTLHAESICDCGDEKQLVIEVLPAPAPTLDCVNSVCPETRQRYTVTTDGCAEYFWTVSANGTVVNGGSISDNFIEVIWHEGPDGFIELAVANCATEHCSFTNIFRVPIITPEGPISGDVSVCSGEIVTYTAPHFPGTTYQWQVGSAGMILGDQHRNAVTIKWDNVNVLTTSTVQVQYENCFLACGGEDQLTVNITPMLRISGDVQVCYNDEAQVIAEAGFNVFSPGLVNWHIENSAGDIVYSHTGSSSMLNHVFAYPPGIYTWVAVHNSANYCNDVLRLNIEVTAEPLTPLAIHGEEEICPGVSYGFTIESAGNYATVWTITDGPGTFQYYGQSCQHSFGTTPPYVVQAAHADIQYQSCTSDPISITLTSATDLSIDGPDEGCFNAIDTFSIEYISGTDYVWEVIPAEAGEIRRSDLNKVEVFWTQSGVVTLRLHACGTFIDKQILVHALPVFNILGPTSACANELVTITTDLPLFPHIWTNDQQSIISNLDQVQLAPGSYAVEITDNKGCMSDMAFQITSYPAPVVHLSSPYDRFFCNLIPNGVEITANTDGADYTYEWFKDDVAIGPGGPVFNVMDFGAYHVAVTNQYGCTTISQKVTYINCCAATCGIPGNIPGCVYFPEDFLIDEEEPTCEHRIFTTHSPDLTIDGTFWLVQSVSRDLVWFSTSDTLDFSYPLPGYYFIDAFNALTGYPYGVGECGHYDRIIDTVISVADFKHDGICAGAPIVFEDLTTFLPGETIASWNWDFDDPSSGAANSSSLQDPTHTFSTSGMYSVTLSAVMASGCTTVRTRTVVVRSGPTLIPVYEQEFCENEAMAFHLPGQLFDITWDFGDPLSGIQNTAVSDSVFHTYSLPGTYTVIVEASDIYECRSQYDFVVDIRDNTLSGVIDVVPSGPLCYGDTALLTAPAGGISWNWNTDEMTSQIQVAESNQYSVLIRDAFNCSYEPPPVLIEVSPKPEILIKARELLGTDQYGPWQSSLGVCYGTAFEIQIFSGTVALFQWTHGPTDQVLQFSSEAGNLPLPGVLMFSVNGIDPASLCVSDTAHIVIEVYALPQTPIITLVSGSACEFDQNVLTVSNPESGISYLWSDGQEGTTITTEAAGLYFVTALNQHGCSAQSNNLLVKPSSPVDQLPGGCFIACDPLTVCLPVMNQISSYSIFQNGTLLTSGTTWPEDFIITEDGTYTIEITSPNGCVATSDPLDVLLYTGVGSITVITYKDIDGDGMIGPGDALLPGIPVQIVSLDGSQIGQTYTDGDASFEFEDYPSSDYTALIDRTLLSSEWIILIDSVEARIATCGDSVVVSLLLTNNCTVAGTDLYHEMCPGEFFTLGDSTWSDTGSYVMHLTSVIGCDSIFNVFITAQDSLEITGVVWIDIDHDGMISAADQQLPGIPVELINTTTGFSEVQLSDFQGVILGYYPTGAFEIGIDTALLPENYIPIIFEIQFDETSCGAIQFEFLVESICPSVFVVHNETLCPGDSIFVQGQWINDAGQYHFVMSDPVTLCDTFVDVNVNVWNEMTVQSIVDWNCQSLGSIVLDVTGDGPFNYYWQQGLPNESVVFNLDPGTYHFEIIDVHGCETTDTALVEGSVLLEFDIQDQYEVEQGDSVFVTIVGDINEPGLQFQWTPSGMVGCPTCPFSWVFPLTDTILTIQIIDADSCIYWLETEILVNIDDDIFAPNVFSPNGDNINDRWTLFSRLENTFVNELTLFDRWGNTLFYKNAFLLNAFEGWDGTFRGEIMNPGVFVYVADVTLGDGRRIMMNGDVTLLR